MRLAYGYNFSGGGDGATDFLGLTDTPATYAGSAGLAPIVNEAEDALIFGTESTVEFIETFEIDGVSSFAMSVPSGYDSLFLIPENMSATLDDDINLRFGAPALPTGQMFSVLLELSKASGITSNSFIGEEDVQVFSQSEAGEDINGSIEIHNLLSAGNMFFSTSLFGFDNNNPPADLAWYKANAIAEASGAPTDFRIEADAGTFAAGSKLHMYGRKVS